MHHIDIAGVHACRADIAQHDVVQEDGAETVRQEHISRYQAKRNHAGHQTAVEFQAVEHQQQRRNNHRDKRNMNRHNVLAHHAHAQNNRQQQPFDRAFAFRIAFAAVEFADNHAGELLRQAGMRDGHGKRAEHGIRQRDLRPAFQAFVKNRNNPLLHHIAGRVGDILQRHTGHQAADKRADSQAEHHMHAR